jgi:putative transposase
MDKSLSHTKWMCKYHIIWIPKYRRKIIYVKYRKEIGRIIRQLCEYKGVEIIEANACSDHIHKCVSIPPKYSVASIMGYLKGKSALMIFDRFANLKYKFGNRHFWAKGYLSAQLD